MGGGEKKIMFSFFLLLLFIVSFCSLSGFPLCLQFFLCVSILLKQEQQTNKITTTKN